MKLAIYFSLSAALLMASAAHAAKTFTSLHPEEAYPDDSPALASPGPYADLIAQAQKKLHEQGFDAGPVNGELGSKTQAAIAQFQLSQALPVNGMLDDETLSALGVPPNKTQSAQSSAPGAEERAPSGSCDALMGPDKEQCLHQGGTVEAGMRR